MIKFIEKIFSGLAYQIGKFLFFVLLALAICFLVDKEKLFDIIGLRVHAATAQDWFEFVKLPSIAYGANCNDTSCFLTDVTTLTGYGNQISRNFYYVSNIYTRKNGNGMMWVYNTDISFKAGYLYSIRTYMCNNSSTEYVHVSFTTGNNVANTHNKSTLPTYWKSVATNSIDDFIGFDTIGEGKCGFVTHFFVPSVNSQYVGVQFTSTESVTGTQALIGYEYDSLGLYTPELRNQIDNAIQDSNLATADDIDKLNEEVKEMTSEQQKTNENLDKINGTLTDSDTSQNTGNDFFDTSSIASSDGVVSALLTLPIQMASKLVDNLGDTCTPYQMNFGMLGKDYTLNFPCIDFEEYLGSNLWHIIDLLFCGFMAYNIAMLFVSIYDSITSLQDYYYSYIYQSSHEEHTRENRRARTPSE